jgi:hypothetical protein
VTRREISRLIADFVADHAGRAWFAVSIALSASLFVAAVVVWSSVFVTGEVTSNVWFVVTSLPSRNKGICRGAGCGRMAVGSIGRHDGGIGVRD